MREKHTPHTRYDRVRLARLTHEKEKSNKSQRCKNRDRCSRGRYYAGTENRGKTVVDLIVRQKNETYTRVLVPRFARGYSICVRAREIEFKPFTPNTHTPCKDFRGREPSSENSQEFSQSRD